MQVHLQNPSTKPLVYRALIRGENAEDFSIAEGKETITVSIYCSLIPRPTPFFVLQFAFTIIHGSRHRSSASVYYVEHKLKTKQKQWGRPGNNIAVQVYHICTVDLALFPSPAQSPVNWSTHGESLGMRLHIQLSSSSQLLYWTIH